MPIAFHAPTHAPQGASPVHRRRDVADDAGAVDAFTMLLLAASAVDEPGTTDDASAVATTDDAAAAANGLDTRAPVDPAATPILVDPAIEAARAAATAAALPQVPVIPVTPGPVTIVAGERLARAGGVTTRADVSATSMADATPGRLKADAQGFATSHADAPHAEAPARPAPDPTTDPTTDLRADARADLAKAGTNPTATADARAFALHLPSLEAPAEAKRAAPGRAPSVDATATVASADATYLRPAPNSPAVLVAAIDTPAFTPGWQEEAVGKMAHVVLTRNERAELTLHPAELGPVSIRVDLAADQASLTIVAASAETRSALEQSLPQLRDLLASQGITLGQASVHDGSARRDDAPPARSEGNAASREAAAAAPPIATTWTVRAPQGRVDLFA